MSGKRNENEDEDLRAFESALGSLQPRRDRLDRRWLLAEPFPSPDDIASSGPAGEQADEPMPSGSCVNPTGHQFACVYCGSVAPISERRRRWGWPMAFSTMTAAAAILLVMFLGRLEPRVALPESSHLAAPADQTRPARPSHGPTMENHGPVRSSSMTGATSYLILRDRALNHRLDSEDFAAFSTATASDKLDRPLTYREQVIRLLKQQGLSGS